MSEENNIISYKQWLLTQPFSLNMKFQYYESCFILNYFLSENYFQIVRTSKSSMLQSSVRLLIYKVSDSKPLCRFRTMVLGTI